MGGNGGAPECQSPEDCDDDNDCTNDSCELPGGVCQNTPVDNGTLCSAGVCRDSVCVAAFPCTEQGIRDAIAAGSGPHFFACNSATTVTTVAEIAINNSVILDGLDNLTVDGNDTHRVFSVSPGIVVELRNFSVIGGGGVSDGGGIYSDGTLTLTGCTVSASDAAGDGGGIYNNGILTLANSEVSRNTADSGLGSGSGAGIYNSGSGTLTLSSSTVARNDTRSAGGGIQNSGTLTATDSTISGNTARSDGGGIGNSGSATATLNSSTVSGNAGGQGGGINNKLGGTVTLVNSTVSENATNDRGGGIYNEGTFVLTNVTLSGNTSTNLNPGIDHVRVGELMTFTNTLIDGDCAGNGDFESKGGNLESPGNTCGFDDSTDQTSVFAVQLDLGPLQNNGGPTLTQAPAVGSFAIDAISQGVCVVLVDQRGEPRPGGTMCDVGAFERQPEDP